MEAKSLKSDNKGKKTKFIDPDGKVIMLTEGDGHGGRVSPTKVSEESDEAVCRICWGTENEDKANEEAG